MWRGETKVASEKQETMTFCVDIGAIHRIELLQLIG